MRDCSKHYVNGEWIASSETTLKDVINPATEEVCGRVALGSAMDVDKAVAAARQAWPSWSQSDRATRIAAFERIEAEYQRRAGDLAAAVTEEMGAPRSLAENIHVPLGLWHLSAAKGLLASFDFEEVRGNTLVSRESIGVCGMITPWNWPLNQLACKVAPAIATGCTMILKPSEMAPFSAQIFAEIMDAAKLPAGVFNLVHGDGPGVGAPLSAHPDVDMISFTGSTRAGVEVARNAAATVKRVQQELGGKSPNIILDDAGFERSVAAGVKDVMSNSGQTCTAPTRMLVPTSRMDEAIRVAREAVADVTVGDPRGDAVMGPVVSKTQWTQIQELIGKGMAEGATLVSGGIGLPEGLARGYYVRPTVFADATNDMTIAREEIFGPVLTIIGYDSIDTAIGIANDTEYGLCAVVSGVDAEQLRAVARRLRAGQVRINHGFDILAPFGGYKKSGNGREWGDFAFHDFLEVKAMIGYDQPQPL